ncbi:M48 family metallopeptidase [Wenzhouxiangella sp. XN79A]|uniref:M48 family metallopeptidase n=1 Tax=Wenzhouxiangella sp. XN79A TaxID=2724193 RepID=UPI00144A899C|nr:M48 family metallopeptidase [Wenzhouxiangella sp. XN79A]NKI33661.1 M48 family metallopeptidase [Wenzhouxiangella sp. XN79A]
MDFFRQQDRARRQTRLLIVAFSAAVLAILVAMNLLTLTIFGRFQSAEQGWFSPSFWLANGQVVALTSAVTLGTILLASLYRTLQLRGGGSQVARELGGVEVDGSTTDPLRRRLLNIVEEMAIASGVPVPEVFVLDHEDGINAFAAGWSPSDAAVAVTRGALENLNREELQGVIAHEFSHVFNGDMRLNIRLMGVLFGILVLAVAGRRMLSSMRFTSGRNRNASAILLIALAVMIIGYIGLFFGRWIQAAVSRQREYLADASAVQFTRSPDGIAGALKKIGASTAGSQLVVNTQEVGHMLFASSLSSRLMATHPPLVDRITRVQPSFDPSEFAEIAASMARHREARAARAEQEAVEAARPAHALPGGISLEADRLAEQVGQPGLAQMLTVAALLAEIPAPLERAAHSDEWAPELLLFLLIAADRELRERQLLMVAETLGSDSEAQVSKLLTIEPDLPVRLRLPLLEMAFPALRRRPHAQLLDFMRLVDRLIEADGRTTVFEYVMARLLNREIEDVLRPPRRMVGGRARLQDHAAAVADLIAIFAHHGQPDDALAAGDARAAAVERIDGIETVDSDAGRDWQGRLDAIFRELDDLSLDARRELIEALVRSARTDGRIVAAEYELLRLVAGLLRVPLPVPAAPGA